MSRAKVVITAEARRDLLQITDYLAEHAGARMGQRWNQKLRTAALGLADEPYAGQADDQLGGRRWLVVRPYLIVYRVASPEEVHVVRIADGRRDLPALFPPDDADDPPKAI